MKQLETIDQFIPELLLSERYKKIRQLLLQVVLILITINVFWDTPDELDFSFRRIIAWLAYYASLNAVIYLNIYVLAPCYLLKDRWWPYLIRVAGIIVGAFLCIGLVQTWVYDSPVDEPVVNNLGWVSMVSSVLSIGLLVAGASTLLLFCYWIISGRRADELQSLSLQSELSYLKNQINPHFLFNMLNNANIMVDEDADLASEILTKLEEMLRYQLNDSKKELVNLSDDIRFLTRYLELEKMRRDDFTYTIIQENIPAGLEIPPLLFIPFVENAVKHSAGSTDKAYVNITFRVQDRELIFTCINSKPSQPLPKKEGGGLGLVNIHRRLALLFHEEHTLEIKEGLTEFTVFLTIKL